jgi:hypothetical protein
MTPKEIRSFENETPLSSLAIMVTPEAITDAINEVCAHLLASTCGSWSPLVASFREKYSAIPTMNITTNYVTGQSVPINPDEWPVVLEASNEVSWKAMLDYDTAAIRLHRHADGRLLLRATVTSDNYDGESDFGLFLPAYPIWCSQKALDAPVYSIEKFLEFLDRAEDWADLMRKFQFKILVAFAPTPAKRAKKTKNVLPSQPRATAFASEGGNKMPSPIQ